MTSPLPDNKNFLNPADHSPEAFTPLQASSPKVGCSDRLYDFPRSIVEVFQKEKSQY